MVAIDGWGGSHWGPRGVSATEAIGGAVAGALMLVYFLTFGRSIGAALPVGEAAAT